MNVWYKKALLGRGSRNKLLASVDTRGSALLRMGRRDRLLAARLADDSASVRTVRVDEEHDQVRVQVEFVAEHTMAIYHFGLTQFADWRRYLQEIGVAIPSAGVA